MNHNHSQSGGQIRHLLLMMLCCLIPLGLILAVSIFGLSLGFLTPYLPFALVLLCPLMMFFMMRGMGQGHGEMEMHYEQKTAPQNTNPPRGAPANTAMESKPYH